MKLLVLGGTRFVGRHLVEAALARGHEVTLFNRGRTRPELFPKIEKLYGDRGGDLSVLAGRRWDAVLDVNGYLPRHVRASARLLAGAVERYVFISTISVYVKPERPGTTEESPLKEPPPGGEEAEEITPESYGWLKVLCERAAEEALVGRALSVRPGLQMGPHDPTGRFTYWPIRTARGGEVLAPGRPERPVQVGDARDLAAWVVRMTEERETGVYNVTGPERPLTMGMILETCHDVAGSDASFTWVDEAFIEEKEIGLPLWQPAADQASDQVDSGKALARGLAFRPLATTVRDLLAWVAEAPEERTPMGLDPEREAELLRQWHRLPKTAPGP